MLLTRKDVGSHIASAPEIGFAPQAMTSGAGIDNVATAGGVIDRLLSGRGLAQSCKILIGWKAVLTAAKSMQITALVQHAAAQVAGTLTAPATLVPQIMRARFAESVPNGFAGAASGPNPLALTWTAVVPVAGVVGPQTVSTGAGGALTRQGIMEVDLDLSEANRYIGLLLTFKLTKGDTDTAVVYADVVLGGHDEEPAL